MISFVPDSTTNLADLARRRAAEQPEKPAYTFLEFRPERKETHLTYGQLHRRAGAIAAKLRTVTHQGDRALLWCRSGPELICGFLGCLYAGVIAVPVAVPRSGQRTQRLESIIGNAQPSVALSTASVKRTVESVLPLKDGLNWICLDEVEDADWAATPIDAGTVAYLQYSSGSTGNPKGIMITHANLAHQSAAIYRASGASRESCCVSWLPAFHDMGLVGGILQPMYGGFPGVLMAPEAFVESPYRWLKAISDFRADVTAAPNFAYQMCVAKVTSEMRESLDLSHWRFAFTGAEPVRAKTMDEFAEAFAVSGFRRESFFPAYGLAEATLMVSGGNQMHQPVDAWFSREALGRNQVACVAPGDEHGHRLVGCGVPVPDQKLAIVDPETCRAVGESEVGEIWVSGPSVGAGYWNREEETAETFLARIAGSGEGLFLRTGDLGFVHGGEVYICGRLKDLILIRGRNHHAPDIELTVEIAHPALRTAGCAAFSIQSGDEERLVVVQELDRKLKNAEPAALEEILAAIRQSIAEQHEIQVHAIVLVRHGAIPKTSSGKVQRRACCALYLEGKLNARAAWVAPGATHEASLPQPDRPEEASSVAQEIAGWLAQAVAARLGVEAATFDARRPIAEFGLSQEAILDVTKTAEGQFRRPLPMTLFMEHPTLEDLAMRLAAAGATMPDTGDGPARRNTPVARQPDAVRTNEPIAIIGIGCRFPGAKGPREFWQMLCDGVDAVTEVPPERWDIDEVYDPNPLAPAKMNTRCGGFLRDLDLMDRKFFGLSIREAVRSDPQHRLMLEVAWEALENAGIAPDEISGTPTGVFVGISASDYAQMQFGDASMTDAYSGLGCALTIAASRVSHFLNLLGPALAIDTACSSSLSAVHLACNSLRQGECTVALAGGVNVLLSPIVTMCLTKAGMMAADGRCKAFDARANGYVRSDGAGMVVLKPLSRALADRDSIYAVIRGTASNQDGRSAGISAPNGDAQQAVILAACQDAGVSPGQLDYVEAHGTGTAVGDPIEAKALGAVLGIDRPDGSYCAIGSVKTNIGHAESAAGVASVIKTALVLKHGQIPPSLHFENPNPLIPFDTLPIRVQTALGPLPTRSHPTLAGVNGFGVGGTNVHLVLEQPPQRPDAPAPDGSETARPYVLPLSARTAASLEAGAHAMVGLLREPATAARLSDVCYTAAARRKHMEHRLAVVGSTAGELAEALASHLEQGHHPAVASGTVPTHATSRPKLVFAFSGQGSQWWGMGRGLFEREPVFRKVIEECDALFRPYTGWSLIAELMAPRAESRLDDTEVVQPALFALQAGLAELWRSWGVAPDAVVGHSAGEVAAAYVAGALDLANAVKLIAHRSRLMQQATGNGKMASVELSLSELEPLLNRWRDRLSIAAVNGPSSVVVSGETDALEALLGDLQPRGVVALPLPVNYAFHSRQMEPCKEQLVRVLETGFTPACVTTPMYSTVTGTWCNGQPLDAHYWGANVRQPVLLAQAIEGLAKDGAEIFIEIGPHPVISGAISRNLKSLGRQGTVIPSLRREEDEQKCLMTAAAKLYAEARPVDWKVLYPKGELSQSLPPYQFDRQRFWLDLPDKQKRRKGPKHPLIGQRLATAQPVWQNKLDPQALPFVKEFRTGGRGLLPGGVFTEAALAAAGQLFDGQEYELADVKLLQPAELAGGDVGAVIQAAASFEAEGEAVLRVFTQPADAGEGKANWPVHLSARAVRRAASGETAPLDMEKLRNLCRDELDGATFYRKLEEIGVHYGTALRVVEQVWRGERAAMVRIRVPEQAVPELEKYRMHPAILEAATQACRIAYGALGLQLELGSVERVRVLRPAGESLYAFAQLRASAEPGEKLASSELWVCDEAGAVIATFEGVQLRPRGGEELVQVPMDPLQWLYDIRWEAAAKAHQGAAAFQGQGSWLIFADDDGTGFALAEHLSEQGERVVLVRHGKEFAGTGEFFVASPGDPEQMRRLVGEGLPAKSPAWRGIVHLWSLDSKATSETTAESIAEDLSLGSISIMHLLQGIAAAELPRAPRLWTVTRGAQRVDASGLTGISQSMVWGLGKVIALEHPELRCCRIDLGPESGPEEIRSLFEECWSNDREDQVALRGEQRLVARLVRYTLGDVEKGGAQAEPEAESISIPAGQPFRMQLTSPGKPESAAVARALRRPPAAGEIEIRVSRTGISGRDLARAGGDEAAGGGIGDACSGTVVRVGPGVTEFRTGDEVMALSNGAAATHLTIRTTSAAAKPAAISHADAATSVRAYAAAVYALRDVARVCEGQHVMIHGADTSLGMAAVQVAKWLGARVLVTACDAAEQEMPAGSGADHVLDAHSLAFASEARRLSDGGVDVALNCSAGWDTARSVPALNPTGHCVDAAWSECGRGANTAGLRFRDNLSFHAVDLDRLMQTRPECVRGLLVEVAAGLGAGIFAPLGARSFPAGQVREALLCVMAERGGRAAIEITGTADEAGVPYSVLREEATYLITGGLGGLGLVIAERMVERGARHLVLAGRKSPTAAAQKTMDKLRQRGANPVAVSVDVADEAQVRSLLDTIAQSMPPLGGVIHAAGVLENGLLVQLDEQRFRKVMDSKVTGAWHLHRLTAEMPLDFFVVFSSLASLIGSPGQGNYAAANAFLEGLALHRAALGMPALSIGWGPWAEVGMAADVHNGARLQEAGMGMLPPEKALNLLELLLEDAPGMVGAIAMNWQLWSKAFPTAADARFVSGLVPGRSRDTGEMLTAGVLAECEPAARSERVEAAIHKAVCQSLQLDPATLTMDVPLTSVGLDSIVGLELKNRLESAIDVVVQTPQILKGPTVRELAAQFLNQMFAAGGEEAQAAEPIAAAQPEISAEAAEAERLLGQLDQLSDADINALLQSMAQNQGA